MSEAVTAYREAIRLKPDLAIAHNSLGAILYDAKRDYAGAAAEFREAIRLKPDLAAAHNNLGRALSVHGKPSEAVAAYREAIRLKPDYVVAHTNLGNTLSTHGKLSEAIASYREAIRLKPDLAMAHHHLGNTLSTQGQLSEAIAAYREAIRLKPDLAAAHHYLGNALRAQGELSEAVAAYREAIRLKPDAAEYHRNLDHAERMAALAPRLPAVLRREDKPRDAAEGLAFAEMSYKVRRYVPSARLYDGALRADPKLADDPRLGRRYNAASAAALAGAGQGEDRPPPDEAEKAHWRKQAVAWLAAELALWTKQADPGPSQSKTLVVRTLRRWKQDPDLAGIRDAAAIQALPEEERKICRALWTDVDTLLGRAEKLGGKP
jgi:tetratricopeptide (TPR) repeat protein